MASKSIGSLYIDIEARTAKMEADVEKVKARLNSFKSSVSQQSKDSGNDFDAMGSKMAGAFMRGGVALGLLSMAFTAVKSELKDVYQNIDNIPGVPTSTIASIHEMSYSLSIAKRDLDQVAAWVLDKFTRVGQGIGVGAAALAGYAKGAADGMDELNKEAERFARIPFEQKFAKLQEAMNGLSRTRGFHADSLKETAGALEALAAGYKLPQEVLDAHPEVKQRTEQFALTGGMTRTDSDNLILEASEKRLEAARIELELRKQATDAERKYNEVAPLSVTMDGATAGFQKMSGRLGLDKQLAGYRAQIDEFNKQLSKDSVDAWNGVAGAQERVAKDYDNLTKAQTHVNELTKRMQEPMKMLRDTFVNTFQGLSDVLANWVTTGKMKFSDFVNTVIQQMLSMYIKLAIINPIMNSLFGGVSGYTAQASLWSGVGAHAAGGPVNSPTMVGELGPELFMPPSGGGTIIPSNQLRGASDGDTYNFNYNISAGVTESVLAPALRQTKRETIAELQDLRRRGKA
jgi:phage-related minor tail protein